MPSGCIRSVAAGCRAHFFVAVVWRHQVLKEWTDEAPRDSQTPAEARAASDWVLGRVEQMLRSEHEEARAGGRSKKTTFRDDHVPKDMPNKYFALSLDNQLRKSGLHGLAYFEPAQKCWSLQPREDFVLVEAAEESRIEGVSDHRVWAVHRTSGARRELIPRMLRDGRLHRPVLHKAQDQGSIGWKAAVWLDNCVGLRGSTTEDKAHRFS